MIRAIIFDCFGVIATDIWLAFCDSLPAGADIETASALNRAYDKGLISAQEFEEGVVNAVGVKPPDLSSMDPTQMAKNEPLLQLISRLSGEYKIGILSNISNNWISDELLTAQERTMFFDIIQSYETGFVKPDTRIFELACRRMGVDSEEAIMIDDRQANVDGAISAGMQGILYTDLRQCRQELNTLLNTNY